MTRNKRLRILVVDDTVIYRKTVSDILAEFPDVEVIGIAHNGKIAISKIASLKPDLLTLDIEMPEINGLQVLEYMKKNAPTVGAIMLSTLTQTGGDMTMKALELGAFDFIPKPQEKDFNQNKQAIRNAIGPMLKAFSRSKDIKSILKSSSPYSGKTLGKIKGSASVNAISRTTSRVRSKKHKSEIVVIGISTGGPNALAQMMPKLPQKIGVPILIVQHMPPIFTKSLANSLNSKCAFDIREAIDGEAIKPNTALIAPGGKQMKIVAGADGKSRIIRITNDPPENSCKPSVDYLFRSIAHHYVGRSTGVIMTGMGSDGTESLKLLKDNGATIIAQDEASCVVYGMPKEPIELGLADIISPLNNIAREITLTVK